MDLIAVLVAIPLTLLGPGWVVARRSPGRADERLCVAIGAGAVVTYLIAATIHWCGLPRTGHVVASLAAIATTLAFAPEIARTARRPAARHGLVAYGSLVVLALALTAVVRCYSGGLWSYDDLEHYERTLFFLGELPPDTAFLGRYHLTARPPLMNLLAAHFLAPFGPSFARFQVAMVAMNALVVIPALLLASRLWPARRASRTVAVALLLASPAVIQNTTFPWTKLFAAFYVLLGVFLVWRARPGEPRRLFLGAGALAAGVLVHYSAAPYALLLCLVLLWDRTRASARHVMGAAAIGFAVLATWVGVALTKFGAAATFGANTTITETADRSAAEHARVIAGNFLATVLPHPLWRRDYYGFDQESALGRMRDYWFPIYQMTLPFACGLIGGVVLLALVWRRVRHASRQERRFWTFLILGAVTLGIGLHSNVSSHGSAHIALLPLIALGTAWLGCGWHALSRRVRVLIAAGAAIDLILGVFAQFAAQAQVVELSRGDGRATIVDNPFSVQTGDNWRVKADAGLTYVSDLFPWVTPIASTVATAVAIATVVTLIRTLRADVR